jgi:hypothetical protein
VGHALGRSGGLTVRCARQEGGRSRPSERQARPKPASAVGGQSIGAQRATRLTRSLSCSRGGRGQPHRDGRPGARGSPQAEAPPVTPLLAASSARCRRTVSQQLEWLPRAPAQSHGHRGRTRRSRAAPWPRRLHLGSNHHLLPARATAPRSTQCAALDPRRSEVGWSGGLRARERGAARARLIEEGWLRTPCGRRAASAAPSPVPILGTSRPRPWEPGNEAGVRDWRSPGAASAHARELHSSAREGWSQKARH